MCLPCSLAHEFVKRVGHVTKKPTKFFVDNKSIIALAKNPVFQDPSKHIDISYHYIRECIARKDVHAEYVKSQEQVVDIFTKSLKQKSFIKLRSLLGMTNQV